MKPRVSIIIPSYNRAHTLDATLQSVFAQTFTDYEIIIIDDGSTDHTKKVVEPYHDRVRYVYQENGGSSAARNHGMRLAQGDLIAFLDSDDLWMPDKLEKQVAYMDANPQVDMSYTHYLRVTDEGQPLNLIDGANLNGHIYKELLQGCEIDTSTVMMRDRVHEVVGTFDLSFDMMQDVDYWIRIARHFNIGVIPDTLTHYRVHAGNKPRDHKTILDLRIRMLDKHFQSGHNLGFLYKHQTYGRFYVRGIQTFLAEDDVATAQYYLAQGWRHILLTNGGLLVIMRIIFRKLLPPSLQSRLRVWRRG